MDKDKFEILKKNPHLLVPQYLGLKDESEIKEAGQMIWDFYLKDKTSSWEQQTENFVMVSALNLNLF